MGIIDRIPLQGGESRIDSWTLLYTPPTGGKYNGKLLVTNQRLIYDAKLDVSAKGLVDELLFVKLGSAACVIIPKERIRSVERKKSLFAKQVVLTLDDHSQHVFNYGMLNIDPVAAAIEQR